MTQLPPPEPPGQPASQLNYASPQTYRPIGGMSPAGQLALGFAAFVAARTVRRLVARLIDNTTTVQRGVLIAPAIALAALVALTVVAFRRWRWRAFLLGVLIGPGLMLVGIGLCFAAFNR